MIRYERSTVLVWYSPQDHNPNFVEVVRYTRKGLLLVVPLPIIIDDVISAPGYVVCRVYPFQGVGYMEQALLCQWEEEEKSYLYKGHLLEVYQEEEVYQHCKYL